MSTTGNLVLPLAAAPIAVQSPLPVNHQWSCEGFVAPGKSAADRSAKEVFSTGSSATLRNFHSIGQTTLARNTKAQGEALLPRS